MKLNTLHLLETTEQELNIMSEVETTRRVFYKDPASEPGTLLIEKTFVSELTNKEAFNFTRFRIDQIPTLLRHWRLEGVTFKLQYQKGILLREIRQCSFPLQGSPREPPILTLHPIFTSEGCGVLAWGLQKLNYTHVRDFLPQS